MATISEKENYINELTKPVSPKLWAEVYNEFTPVVLSKKFGDGNQLIWFQTNDSRPYWWWVWIDSKTNVTSRDSDDFDPAEIWEAISDEFGEFDWDDEDNQSKDATDFYPMIDRNGGCMWGSQEIFNQSSESNNK